MILMKWNLLSDLDPAIVPDPFTGAEVKSINLNKNRLDEFPEELFAFVPGPFFAHRVGF